LTKKLDVEAGKQLPSRPLPFGSEDVNIPNASSPRKSPEGVLKRAAETALPASPAPQIGKPKTSNTTTTAGDGKRAQMEEPSYTGPSAAFEKDEDYMKQDTPMPPTEEEQDAFAE
jgi:glycogenin glucosyltransferase